MDRKLLLLIVLFGGALFSACGGPTPLSSATENAKLTQDSGSAATLRALEQEVAQLRTEVAHPGQMTAISAGTDAPVRPTATPTRLPPTATLTPVPPTVTPTATTLPCNMAQFMGDVTIPDGTQVAPGTSFSKTWRLKNIGSCAWTTDYALIFDSGDRLGAPSGILLPGNVQPGQVIDLSVDLVAPGQEGHYRGNWRLRDGAGKPFGLGRVGNVFYVDITVAQAAITDVLDFAAAYCQAVWTSGAGELPCPGQTNDSRGFVRRIANPALENGFVMEDPALLTYPQMIADGVIRGKYPAITVRPGYNFAAVIGCAYQAEACDVKFQLDYQIGDGGIQTLGAWNEVYDGQFHLVEIDLDGLVGNDVSFILTVFANGASSQDRALWMAPHVGKHLDVRHQSDTINGTGAVAE